MKRLQHQEDFPVEIPKSRWRRICLPIIIIRDTVQYKSFTCVFPLRSTCKRISTISENLSRESEENNKEKKILQKPYKELQRIFQYVQFLYKDKKHNIERVEKWKYFLTLGTSTPSVSCMFYTNVSIILIYWKAFIFFLNFEYALIWMMIKIRVFVHLGNIFGNLNLAGIWRSFLDFAPENSVGFLKPLKPPLKWRQHKKDQEGNEYIKNI